MSEKTTIPKTVTVDNAQLRQMEKSAIHRIQGDIKSIRSTLDRIEVALRKNHMLNNLGELQARGPMLDAAIAELCTIRELQRMGYDWAVEDHA